jgi:hypothetical protein
MTSTPMASQELEIHNSKQVAQPASSNSHIQEVLNLRGGLRGGGAAIAMRKRAMKDRTELIACSSGTKKMPSNQSFDAHKVVAGPG